MAIDLSRKEEYLIKLFKAVELVKKPGSSNLSLNQLRARVPCTIMTIKRAKAIAFESCTIEEAIDRFPTNATNKEVEAQKNKPKVNKVLTESWK